mgnify:CR=1 FL=1
MSFGVAAHCFHLWSNESVSFHLGVSASVESASEAVEGQVAVKSSVACRL